MHIRTGIISRFFLMLGVTLSCLLLSACDIGSPALPTSTSEGAVTPSATLLRNDATQTPSQPQTTAEATPASASPTTVKAANSRIIYLAPDSFTVMSVRQDGSMPRTEAVIEKMPDQQVINLSTDPTGKYKVYNLASTDPDKFLLETHLVQNNQDTKIASLAGSPRWSPDASRFAAQEFTFDVPGAIFLYELSSNKGEMLPVRGSPSWSPDGKRLIYTTGTNIFSYDIETTAGTPLTTLPDDENNAWNVAEAHVLQSGDRIIFFGGEALKDGQPVLGPHGEEQVWWWIPSSGGTPQHWSEIVGKAGGVGNYAASPRRDRIAVSHIHFAGATCPAYEDAAVVGFDIELGGISSTLPITATSAPNTGIDPGGAWVTQVNGITWSPDGSEFAYGVERHACSPEGPADNPLSSTIYVWDGDPDKDPRFSIEGSYPNWVRADSP